MKAFCDYLFVKYKHDWILDSGKMGHKNALVPSFSHLVLIFLGELYKSKLQISLMDHFHTILLVGRQPPLHLYNKKEGTRGGGENEGLIIVTSHYLPPTHLTLGVSICSHSSLPIYRPSPSYPPRRALDLKH